MNLIFRREIGCNHCNHKISNRKIFEAQGCVYQYCLASFFRCGKITLREKVLLKIVRIFSITVYLTIF